MKISNILVFIAATLIAASASAQWQAGVGYGDIGRDDISVGVAYASIGYEFPHSDLWRSFPHLKIGMGINDFTIAVLGGEPLEVEVDNFIQFAYRAEFGLVDGVYVFLTPSLANVEFSASIGDESESGDTWEFGFGGGIGIALNETFGLEAGYETFDGLNVASAGLRFSF